ncbi:unnamed protein product [Larinioides sclopetarius]|uniref:BED-type domain-containing protein n=1 Tax=Larinioides sclopetarius TaxID=280406 RepID=A0AAV1ZG04_9ARAC
MSGKSESEKERKCKRSACWHFYDKTPGGGFCRICQKEILTQAGGTTNLRNHLRRRHGELWTATMENRLDPSTLSITDRRPASIIKRKNPFFKGCFVKMKQKEKRKLQRRTSALKM